MSNLIRTLIDEGWVSLTVADTTEMVKTAQKLHRLSKTSAQILGKALSAMTFMSSCLKNEQGEISLSFQTDGESGSIGVSGNRALTMRGYIQNTELTKDTEISALGNKGAFTIIRDDGYNRPFVGTCAMPVGGDLDDGFEEYYAISEQLFTRLATKVEFDENGEVTFAGVIALQPLPFASEEIIVKTENAEIDFLFEQLKHKGVVATAKDNFKVDESVFDERFAQYKCNCSREYLSRVLVSLGEAELRRIIKEDGDIKVHCHYCNSDYSFDETDADELFKKE